MKMFISILAFISSMASCSSGNSFIDAHHQVILSDINGIYDPAKEISVWHPTTKDTNKALTRIHEYLISKRNTNSDIDSILKHWKEYGVQFAGISRNHKKYIFCNFFCFNEDCSNWRTSMVFVFDGGFWFWNIEYNTDDDTCESLSINGVA